METIQTQSRIHPLMAAAAVSVIIVSLAGAAAISGILPSSHSAPEAQTTALAPVAAPNQLASAPVAAPFGANGYAQAPVALASGYAPGQAGAPAMAPVAYAQPAPVVTQEAPAVKPTPKPRVVHHYHTQVARNDAPRNYEQPAPQPVAQQPNYLGIGAGALIGGLIGNQVGGGNGKKLATVAGVIGGGMLGNEVANRNR
jgi:hypothetical protein